MDPLEAGAVHQAMPQGVIQHGARTVEQVQRGTDKPRTNDQRKAHMRPEKRFWQHGAYKPEEESHGPSGKRSW